jgi:hypothetical protein
MKYYPMTEREKCTIKQAQPTTILTLASRTRTSSTLLGAASEEEAGEATSTRTTSTPCSRISLEEPSEEVEEAKEEAGLKVQARKTLL